MPAPCAIQHGFAAKGSGNQWGQSTVLRQKLNNWAATATHMPAQGHGARLDGTRPGNLDARE